MATNAYARRQEIEKAIFAARNTQLFLQQLGAGSGSPRIPRMVRITAKNRADDMAKVLSTMLIHNRK